MRRFFKIAFFVVIGLMILSAAALFAAYRASQHEPEFYRQAVAVDPETQRDAGDEMERRLLDLRNSARHVGAWSVSFSVEHINGWLAVDLVENTPDALPSELENPRIALNNTSLLVGCKYQTSRISTVIWADLEIQLSDIPNTIAIRIRKARAGSLPVPLGRVMDHLSAWARDAEIPFRWAQTDGDPVALVTVSIDGGKKSPKRLTLEQVGILDGEIVLSGQTVPLVENNTATAAANAVEPHAASQEDTTVNRQR